MTRATRAIFFGWALASAGACSASNPPAVAGQSTVLPTQTATSGEDAGGREIAEGGADASGADASGSPTRPDAGVVVTVTCDAFAAEGSIVEELAVAGPEPDPLGGKIEPGTYVLFELYDYPGEAGAGGTTGLAARKSLVLGTTTYRLADAEGTDDAGVGSSTVTGGTYAVAGTTLTWSEQCPSLSTSTNEYSAAGSQLGVYRGTHFEVYELQTPP
jgi:hypothetical protein